MPKYTYYLLFKYPSILSIYYVSALVCMFGVYSVSALVYLLFTMYSILTVYYVSALVYSAFTM